ncbi:hypothetical protein OF83DRAFT_569830 [Amylostereum chailletii]|nr:hypothetical protein OF83DRAFT_569830 [Amylostereum chailletii]
MYHVLPIPASYGDSEGMKTVWAESWPLLRAQDRRERKVAFLHLSRATFSSFVDSVLSPFTALRRMFGTFSFPVFRRASGLTCIFLSGAEKTLPVSKKVTIVVDGPTAPPPSYCSQTSGSSVPSSWLNADELRSPVLSGSESTTGVAVPPPSHQSMRTKDGFVSVPLLPFLFFGFCEFPLGLYLARLSSVYRTRLSRLRKFIIFHYCVLFGSSSDGD